MVHSMIDTKTLCFGVLSLAAWLASGGFGFAQGPWEITPESQQALERGEGGLGLGERGYLTIREDDGSYELQRTGKTVDWLPGEMAVSVLAPPQGSRSIDRTYNPEVQAARAGLDRALALHFGEKLFSRNSGSLMSVARPCAAKNRMRKPANQVNVSSGVAWRYALIVSWNLPCSTVFTVTAIPVFALKPSTTACIAFFGTSSE